MFVGDRTMASTSPAGAVAAVYPRIFCGEFFAYFNVTGRFRIRLLRVNRRNNCALHYSVDLRIQTYTEPVKLDTEYPWIDGYFYSAYTFVWSRQAADNYSSPLRL